MSKITYPVPLGWHVEGRQFGNGLTIKGDAVGNGRDSEGRYVKVRTSSGMIYAIYISDIFTCGKPLEVMRREQLFRLAGVLNLVRREKENLLTTEYGTW